MLNVSPETICYLIAKAREFEAKEQVVIPEEPFTPTDDWALQVLADHMDDMTIAEVRTILEDMDDQQRAEVVALMWLGRGDYDIEEWEQAVEDALDSQTERTAEYLLAHPLVADHLEEGLIQHEYSCEE
ncbi:MAG: DUF3775 domain-containing protein [Chromatiales bacterium]|jgi:hypothetical protein